MFTYPVLWFFTVLGDLKDGYLPPHQQWPKRYHVFTSLRPPAENRFMKWLNGLQTMNIGLSLSIKLREPQCLNYPTLPVKHDHTNPFHHTLFILMLETACELNHLDRQHNLTSVNLRSRFYNYLINRKLNVFMSIAHSPLNIKHCGLVSIDGVA